MPRTSRSVAQRLASQQQKPKKRRTPRPGVTNPAPSPSIDEILDEVVPSESGSRAAMTPTLSPSKPASESSSPAASRPASARPVGRRAAAAASARLAKTVAPRRRFHEYAEEYQYIWADLQRIVVVAGVLIALLVVLSFFIQ